MLLIPVISVAAEPLVPCLTTGKPGDCDLKALMQPVDNVIQFILIYMAVPIAAIMFAFAGFKLVTSGGSSEARTKAKSIFFNAALGLALAAGAWIIIKTLLTIVGYKDGQSF